jgi:beta-1,4-N-acetylglucosaminyltransferase
MRAKEAGAQVLLVASPGGHLYQLVALGDAWRTFSHAWVTLERSDTRSLLEDERVFYAHGPTDRNIVNLLRNLVLAWRLLRTIRPAVILTTGAALAVPFAWIGRLFGASIVYVESFTRIDQPSLSYRLVAPVADRMYVQWPELADAMPNARYVGSVFSHS